MSVHGVGPTPAKVTNAASLGATANLDVYDVRSYDNVALQLNWTGTPTGSFALQASLDFDGTTGSWATLSPSVGGVPTPAGVADTALLEVSTTAISFLRLAYTRTSGTGAIDVWAVGKED